MWGGVKVRLRFPCSCQDLWWNDWMNVMNDRTCTPRCWDRSVETVYFHTRSEILARNKDVCFTDYSWIITALGREDPRNQTKRVGAKQCGFSVGGMERMVLVCPHFLLKCSSSHGLTEFLWNRDWAANCRFVSGFHFLDYGMYIYGDVLGFPAVFKYLFWRFVVLYIYFAAVYIQKIGTHLLHCHTSYAIL